MLAYILIHTHTHVHTWGGYVCTYQGRGMIKAEILIRWQHLPLIQYAGFELTFHIIYSFFIVNVQLYV